MWQLTAFWYSSGYWESMEYFAEAYVIAAAAMELFIDHELILSGETKATIRKESERGATIALIVGLAVGLLALIRTNVLFNEQIACLYQDEQAAYNRSERAENRAAETTTLATDLRKDANEFKKQAHESEESLRKATAQLDLVQRRREPRDMLILEASIGTNPKLAPFEKQDVIVMTCLEPTEMDNPDRAHIIVMVAGLGCGENPVELERNKTSFELRRQLETVAHWKTEFATGPCKTSRARSGMKLYVDSLASDRTRRAATAISQVLRKALLLETFRPYAECDPQNSFVITVSDAPFR